MKKSMFFSMLLAIFFCGPAQSLAEKAPQKIAGFVLGDQVALYIDLIRMETTMPIRDQQYLRIAQTKDLDGYKSGTIAFANCAEPGRIVRIKLKYAFSDKEFYNELLERFKKNFGEPDEWRGDPFHVIIAWKWAFRNEANNKISLTLQHSRDEEYKWGNSVKLTNTTLVEKERLCYQQKKPGKSDEQKSGFGAKKKSLTEKDYQRFVPE